MKFEIWNFIIVYFIFLKYGILLYLMLESGLIWFFLTFEFKFIYWILFGGTKNQEVNSLKNYIFFGGTKRNNSLRITEDRLIVFVVFIV